MENKIELGKEYNFAGYRWVPVRINEENQVAIMQSLGVTAGLWPGYSMSQFGNGYYCSQNISSKDISDYDNKTRALMEQIRPIVFGDAGLYLPSYKNIMDNYGWKNALAKAAANYRSFGAPYHCAWTGTYGGSSNYAWIVDSDGCTYNNGQSGSYVVPAAFNLDLSKVEIMGDEIVIAGTKLCVTEESIQKASKDSKQMWIIATCDSDGDGIWMDKIEATEDQIKNKMVDMVANLRGEDPDAYENGTEWPDEVQTNGTLFANKDSLYACANFVHSHVDISAIRLDDIPEINQ